MSALAENFTCRRQANEFIGANNQFSAELALKQPDLLTDGGLGKSEAFPRGSKAAFIGQREERFEQLDIQGSSPNEILVSPLL